MITIVKGRDQQVLLRGYHEDLRGMDAMLLKKAPKIGRTCISAVIYSTIMLWYGCDMGAKKALLAVAITSFEKIILDLGTC